MTTLYFEASDEDDLRKTGFSKGGKHQNPQIYLGLLVGLEGYVIGYDIFEGNIYEGHTLIPFLEKITAKFNLNKPIVVADAGLLSNDNIMALEQKSYQFSNGTVHQNAGSTMDLPFRVMNCTIGMEIKLHNTESKGKFEKLFF